MKARLGIMKKGDSDRNTGKGGKKGEGREKREGRKRGGNGQGEKTLVTKKGRT